MKKEVISEPIEEQIRESVIEDLFASDPILERVNIPGTNENKKTEIIKQPEHNHISGMTVKKQETPVVPTHNPFIHKDTEYLANKKTNDNYISDDQFFDDFFGEDD